LRDATGWIAHNPENYNDAALALCSTPPIPLFLYHIGMTLYKQGDKAGAKQLTRVNNSGEFIDKKEARETLKGTSIN